MTLSKNVVGQQGRDDFHVGPFTVKRQTFGMIEEENGDAFKSIPFEGILGLAFPSMSANGVTTFFDNVMDQKVLKSNEFSFYFNVLLFSPGVICFDFRTLGEESDLEDVENNFLKA